MAFHVACPITCRRICFCAWGFPGKLRGGKSKNDFLEEVARVEQFLNDPWLIKSRENARIQVKVPKVVVSHAPPPPQLQFMGTGDEAAAASMVPEDYSRRFESDDLKDVAREEQGHSSAKVMCRRCFSGETEGSERAKKMLSCNSCDKKYHRGCVKAWSRHRDLFHWSLWSCPSCRICEVCQRTGDPNKFIFCKRCDGAYHCYCQQPPHKNVGQGPYLCPKHTKCHSCGSSVPGNGLSVRWFLGYTCCDACGRLFVKGNYCPVCLKVYRDSESTPMVCCDICQSWVHCPCDGISEAKYMQFQADGNLQYSCPACRGECSQIKNLEEAVQELWTRRDDVDRDLITSLRLAAGLPTQKEIFEILPFSDDEESGALLPKNEVHTLKFSVKELRDNSPKRSGESGKRSSKKSAKKREQDDAKVGYVAGTKNENTQISGEPATSSPVVGSAMEGTLARNETAGSKRKNVNDVTSTSLTKAPRTIRIKSNTSHGPDKEEIEINAVAPKAVQGPKLVIHLGGRGKVTTSSPGSEASSFRRSQYLTSSNGKQTKGTMLLKQDRDSIKLDTTNSEVSKFTGAEFADEYGSGSAKNTSEAPISKQNIYSLAKDIKDESVVGNAINDSGCVPSIPEAPTKARRPFLKFKIPKNTSIGNQNVSIDFNTGSQNQFPVAIKDNEMTCTRGQRSKRQRPVLDDEDAPQMREDETIKNFADANWILKKLGKDATGKRVEIHHASDDSWHRGTVIEVREQTSTVSVALDGGQTKSFELRKQGIRFVSQKQKG